MYLCIVLISMRPRPKVGMAVASLCIFSLHVLLFSLQSRSCCDGSGYLRTEAWTKTTGRVRGGIIEIRAEIIWYQSCPAEVFAARVWDCGT